MVTSAWHKWRVGAWIMDKIISRNKLVHSLGASGVCDYNARHVMSGHVWSHFLVVYRRLPISCSTSLFSQQFEGLWHFSALACHGV